MEVVALVILGVLVFIALKIKRASEQEAQDRDRKQQMNARLEYKRAMREKIGEAARPHLERLRTKTDQMIYSDEYGNVVADAWQRELRYFLEHARLGPTPPFFEEEEDERFRMGVLEGLVIQHIETAPTQAHDKSYEPTCTGTEFESIVDSIFARAGGEVRRTPATGDQGVDLLVCVRGNTIAVQCKRSASPVGNKAVQEAYTGMQFYSADEAWVVSDASFTKSARQLAETIGVKLVDFRLIEERLGPRN